MNTNGLVRLELNKSEFYAGDEITAVLRLESQIKQNISVLAIQLLGMMSVNHDIVDGKGLEVLRNVPSYVIGSQRALGGGQILNTKDQSRQKSDEIPIYSTPPSVIAVDINLDKTFPRSFEWKMFVDKSALPSYSGKVARIFYKLIVSLEFGPKKSSTTFETYIRILAPYKPSLNAQISPLHLYDILQPHSSFQDESTSIEIAEGDTGLSPKERLAKNELITLDMIINYHANGTKKRAGSCVTNNPSEECYAMLMENQQPCKFAIKRDQQRIATLSIPRELLRAGESLVANLNFENAELTTFQLRGTLEEYETVMPSFSMNNSEIEADSVVLSSVDQVVWQRDRTSFRLGVPLSSFSTLHTNLFTHKFRLRLVLWVADGKSHPGPEEIPQWLGCTPDTPFVERFELCIPLVLIPFPSSLADNVKAKVSEFAF